MRDLVVVAFPTEEKAEEVRQKLLNMRREYLIELGDAVTPVPGWVISSDNSRCFEQPEVKMKVRHRTWPRLAAFAAGLLLATTAIPGPAQAQEKRPNIVMLMTDDTGWNDFAAYTGGGAALGHPTPNIDRIAKEGALFTSWY